MVINFSKMHGLGNDFVVIDAITQKVDLGPEHIRFLADRHFGIGCDQLLLVETTHNPVADFRYRIFNADGNEVEQCGNGARCFARFVRKYGLTDKDDFAVETAAGIIRLIIEPGGEVTVDMGVPRFEPKEIPFIVDAQATTYHLDINGDSFDLGVVSMGNPHAILTVPSVANAQVERFGPMIEWDSRFPRRVNVGFMEIVDRNHIRLRVHERGVGETLACGSGACAAVVSGHRQGLLGDKVAVELTGGTLSVQWAGGAEPVYMTGPALHVFEGKIEL